MRSFVHVLLAVVALAFLTGAHCNNPVINDLLKCEGNAAAEHLPALVPIVASILASGGTNPAIDASLLGLAVEFGMDSVDCAIAAVIAAWQAAATQPSVLPQKLPTFSYTSVALAAARGKAWLDTRGQAKRTVGLAGGGK